MTKAARTVCRHPGCFQTATQTGRCGKHQGDVATFGHNAQRTQWHFLYQLRDWKRLRESHLRQHPFCIQCAPQLVRGSQVDHKLPHNGDLSLFFDASNLQTLCHSHHSAKTMHESNRVRESRR